MTDSEGVANKSEAEDLEGDLSLDGERSEDVVGGISAKKLAEDMSLTGDLTITKKL